MTESVIDKPDLPHVQIAARCRAGLRLCDYIVKQEAAAMADETRLHRAV